MSQVGFAAAATDLGARLEHLQVDMFGDRIFANRLVEAGPTALGIELRVRLEQRQPAADAAILARLEEVPELVAERPLGAGLASDVVLQTGELFAPVDLRPIDLFGVFGGSL